MPVKPIVGVSLALNPSLSSSDGSLRSDSIADVSYQSFRRGIVLDLSVAFGTLLFPSTGPMHPQAVHTELDDPAVPQEVQLLTSLLSQVWAQHLGISSGMVCEHQVSGRGRNRCNGRIQIFTLYTGYHVPATRKRDLFYAKLEREREEKEGTL